MPHEILVGSSCYTASTAQELKARANKTSQPAIKQIRGQWVYYVDLVNPSKAVLDQVKELTQRMIGRIIQRSYVILPKCLTML